MRALMAVLFLAAPLGAAQAACDIPITVERALPAPDAADVPLNARVWVVVHHGDNDELELTLFRDGVEVPASRTTRVGGALSVEASHVWVLTPQAELAPSTTYTVRLGGSALTLPEGVTAPWEWSFTTGTAADQTPPSYAGISDLRWSQEPASSDDCGAAPQRWRFEVDGPEASEEVAIYAAYRQGFPIANGGDPALVYEGFPEPGATSVCVALRAVDIAGNVSDSGTERCVPVSGGGDTGGDTDETGWRDTWTRWDSGWRDTWTRWDTWRDWEGRDDCGDLTLRVCSTNPAAGATAVLPLLLLVLARRRR